MPPQREQQNPNRGRRRQEAMPGGYLWVVVLLLLGVVLWITFGFTGFSSIDYSDFEQLVVAGKVSKVTLREGSNSLVAELKEGEEIPEAIKKQLRNSNRVEVMLWKGDVDSGQVSKLLKEHNIPRKTERELGSAIWQVFTFLFFLIVIGSIFFFIFMPSPR